MKLIIDIPDVDYKKINSKEKIITISCDIASAIKNGIPLEQIRAEIYQLHCHPKLDFIKTDEVVDMALDIIDNYREEQTDAT